MAQENSSSNLPLLSARAQGIFWNIGYVFSILIGFSFPMPLNTLIFVFFINFIYLPRITHALKSTGCSPQTVMFTFTCARK